MGRERREFERVESLVSVKYFSKAFRVSGCSLTRDVSRTGIGLPVSGKIPPGTRLDLKILLEGKVKLEIPATAKVVWSRRNGEHWKSRYSAGLEFLNIDPADADILLQFAKEHRWIKSDFERALEEDKVPVLGGKGEFLI